MQDSDTSKFKIRIDEESPDAQFLEEIDEHQAARINRRITRISILILCLVGVVFVIAYFAVQQSLIKINTTGTMGVQTLSKDLESRFSSLSLQQAKLEENFEKEVASIQQHLKEATTAIRYIRSARKADNSKIESMLNDSSEELKAIASDIKQLDHRLTKEIANLSQNIERVKEDVLKNQANIVSLSSSKVDKKILDLEIKTQEQTNQKRLLDTTRSLENKINVIEKKLKELGLGTSASKTQPKTTAKKQEPTPPAATKPAPSPQPVQPTTKPQPGTIIEQDLK